MKIPCLDGLGRRPGPNVTLRVFCLALLLGGVAAAQTAPDMRELLLRIERLEDQNRALALEIRALRDSLAGRLSQPEAAAAAEPAVAGPSTDERLAVVEARVAEQAQTKIESSQKFPIRVTGMALFNAFYNSRGSGGVQYPTLAAPGTPASAGGTFRQTVIGLELRGPVTFAGGNVSGEVQFDLFGGSGRILDQTMRLRRALAGIDWRTRSVVAGLEKPLIAQREPTSLAQVGISPLTGAGNLWLWIPQVRFEQRVLAGENAGVRFQGAVVQTREVLPGAASIDYADTYTPELESSRPGFEGRVEFFAGRERRIEIAPGFHRSVTHAAHTSIPSNIFSVDWLVRPWEPIDFTGTFFTGENVMHLGTGGIRQGFIVLSEGSARAVRTTGGWAQLTYRATPRLSFNLFSGDHDDRNRDLRPGTIGRNLAYGANLMFRLAPNVILGLESAQIRTTFLGQGVRHTNHYDLGLAYLF